MKRRMIGLIMIVIIMASMATVANADITRAPTCPNCGSKVFTTHKETGREELGYSPCVHHAYGVDYEYWVQITYDAHCSSCSWNDFWNEYEVDTVCAGWD